MQTEGRSEAARDTRGTVTTVAAAIAIATATTVIPSTSVVAATFAALAVASRGGTGRFVFAGVGLLNGSGFERLGALFGVLDEI